ncbi:trypsin-like peptidase domain-containing protein [Winogradskyella sp. F6397]|uniref:Trypsin-like peptidase domain-containing protein n=1 Tax=Winogradskyella marina TaxID=2785530 RepID=A0ABS0EKT4_9FLAO|nr:serine protease [Winogradskyella marina]MBF8150751.1 trypsin-like peptidase domain-containing protein [Winogradskyella marina]
MILVVNSCNSTKKVSEAHHASIEISDDESENSTEFVNAARLEVDKLVAANEHTPFEKLKEYRDKNFEANSGVELTRTEQTKKTGNQMYYHLQKSTLYIGSSYLCDRCPNVHLSAASGFVIHEDGVIVTNYHVIAPKDKFEYDGLFAIDHEGNVYVVTEVLSASKSNDLAILKVETKGKKLNALPLAENELIGEDIYVMGHPFKNTFFMTKGIISRKHVNSKGGNPRISITAEFGLGASGGPVVNDSGQVVGVVSATRAHYYGGNSKHKGDLQLLVKVAVPVSQLNKYVQ